LTNNCISKDQSPLKQIKKINAASSGKKNRDNSIDVDEDVGGDEEEDPENIWSLDEFKEFMNKSFSDKIETKSDESDKSSRDVFTELI
jgi:hypothetical protein